MAVSVATRYGDEMEDTPASWNWKKAPKVTNPGHIIGYLRCIRYQSDNAPRAVREEMEAYIEKLTEIEKFGNAGLAAKMENGKVFKVSRSYTKAIREKIV